MGKVYYSPWEKEIDLPKALLRHESKLDEASATRHDRITRLLKKENWLRNYIASCCQAEWRYGKWMFRPVIKVGEREGTPLNIVILNKTSFLNKVSLEWVDLVGGYEYGEWVDINRILLDKQNGELNISNALPVWLKETREFFTSVVVKYPSVPVEKEYVSKGEDVSLFEESLKEVTYPIDTTIDVGEMERCVREVKGPLIDKPHPLFNLGLRRAIWETLGGAILPGQFKRAIVVPGSFIQDFILIEGRWYITLKLHHKKFNHPVGMTYPEKIKCFLDFIKSGIRAAGSDLKNIRLSEGIDCFLELHIPLNHHIHNTGFGIYKHLKYLNGVMEWYCDWFGGKELGFYLKPVVNPLEQHRGICAIAGVEVEYFIEKRYLRLTTQDAIRPSNRNVKEAESIKAQALINSLWK